MLDSVLSARKKHEAEKGRRQCLEAGGGGLGVGLSAKAIENQDRRE